MVDYQRGNGNADPYGALQDIGHEVKERREYIAGAESDFNNDQYDRRSS